MSSKSFVVKVHAMLWFIFFYALILATLVVLRKSYFWLCAYRSVLVWDHGTRLATCKVSTLPTVLLFRPSFYTLKYNCKWKQRSSTRIKAYVLHAADSSKIPVITGPYQHHLNWCIGPVCYEGPRFSWKQ